MSRPVPPIVSSNADGWLCQTVAGHPCFIREPSALQSLENQSRNVIVYLHDDPRAEGSASVPPTCWVDLLLEAGISIVAPQSAESLWLPRINPTFASSFSPLSYVQEEIMPFVRNRYDDSCFVGLAGIGTGGQGCLQLSYRFPNLFPVAAVVRPAIDFYNLWRQGDSLIQALYEDAEAARQESALLHIHPLNWPRNQFFACDPMDVWYEGCDRLRMKLGSVGVPFQAELELSTGGDADSYHQTIADRLVRFLLDRLQSERLRIM